MTYISIEFKIDLARVRVWRFPLSFVARSLHLLIVLTSSHDCVLDGLIFGVFDRF